MNKEELDSLGKGDAIVEEYKTRVCALNDNPNFVNTITKERERVLMHNTALELAYEDGEEQGRKEQQLEIARKMLQKGKEISEIQDFTELTFEEIERLKETEN